MNSFTHEVTVRYDDSKVSLETIIKKLTDGGFPPEGEPRFIK